MERVADYIIRKVNEAGAGHIFMVTGRGILYLTDAVAKNENITQVCTFHEQGASYAAMAYASARDGVSACLVSTGCASTNAVTATLCAYQDNLPVIFISGNNPLNENTRHTGSKIRTYGSQEADIISIVESVTKYSIMLEDPSRAVYEVEKALFMAQEGRKGPVWIDVPLDVQNMRIEEGELEHFSEPEKKVKDIVSEVKTISQMLNKAERPIMLIGGGSREGKGQIRHLAEDYNIPVVCSPAATDIYGTAHELSIGTIGSVGGSRAGNFAIQNSDFVLCLGSKLCSQLTGVRSNFAREAKIIVVDIDENEHAKEGEKITFLINCSVKKFMETLFSIELKLHDRDWADKCIRWKKVFAIENEEFVKECREEGSIELYSLMDELGKVLPEEATVITDAGFEELIVPSAIAYRDGQRALFPAAQGAMGYAIPAIIGAYTTGRKNIVCIVGDGSIMMNIQELQVISSMKIPAKILVINNDMYAVIRKRQKDLFRKRIVGVDPENGVSEPDFKKIAECFGFGYKKIENREGLEGWLPGFDCNSPQIVEIMSSPDQRYFHESYALNEKRKLVHRPIEDMSPFLPRKLIKSEMVIDMPEE